MMKKKETLPFHGNWTVLDIDLRVCWMSRESVPTKTGNRRYSMLLLIPPFNHHEVQSTECQSKSLSSTLSPFTSSAHNLQPKQTVSGQRFHASYNWLAVGAGIVTRRASVITWIFALLQFCCGSPL